MKTTALVLIKPDALHRKLIGFVINCLEMNDLVVERVEMRVPDDSLLKDHYKPHEGKDFFDGLIQSMSGKKLIAMIVSSETSPAWVAGSDIGPSPAWVAGRYAVEAARSILIKGHPRYENLIHCSDSESEAKREEAIWFPNS